MKSRHCAGLKVYFSVLILTSREERRPSNIEVEAQASCLDCAARSQLSRYGNTRTSRRLMWTAILVNTLGGMVKTLMEMFCVNYKPQELSVVWMNVYVKVGVPHIENLKPHAFF